MEAETLGKLLVEHGLLAADEVERLLKLSASSGESLEHIIRSKRLVYPEVLAQLKAKALDLPYIDLNTATIDPQAMEGISDQAARAYQFVAFGQKDDKLLVALASPEDWQSREAIRFIAAQRRRKIEVYCASPEAIARSLHGAPEDTVRQALQEFGREFRQAKTYPPTGTKLADALVKAPVTKVVAVIMRHAIDGLASDIHIEPGTSQVRVRYRIDGRLHTTLLLPAEVQTGLALRIKSLAGLSVAQSDLPQEGRFTLTTENQTYGIRVAIIPTVTGERITMRLSDTSGPPPSFLKLGLTKAQQATVIEHLHASDGLIIFSGPGGSGKSTTILAALWEINTPDTAIATVEDPIEYMISGVSQTQIRPAAGLTTAKAVAGLLRHDVDIIMISELTSSRTTQLAVRGATRGKLMLAALSAKSCAQAISRLLDVHPSPYLISEALRLVVSQRLLPRLCQTCREEIKIPADARATLVADLKKIPKPLWRSLGLPSQPALFDSPGCSKCHKSGIRGQVGLFEVVPISPEVKSQIATGSSQEALEKTIRTHGYPSLSQSGLIKALQGLVRYSDVVRFTA